MSTSSRTPSFFIPFFLSFLPFAPLRVMLSPSDLPESFRSQNTGDDLHHLWNP